LSNAFLLHGGGWKKLLNEKISNKEFKKKFLETCKLSSIHDYYGMIEQTGSINVECRYGHLHTSIYNDIIIRDPYDFSPLEFGNEGLIQLISTIPKSYPGQSILTEDIGVVLGEDDCLCGRKGKYFKVIGRMKNAEIRGCSDAT
jgi:phenylacetate-coenzyme A ligase PaaK-like adenylate-forming protein